MRDYFNVFTPDRAVASIEKFAGRQRELDKLSDALQSEGTSLVLYGNRGVGKSSLARQLEGLAAGSAETARRLTHAPFRPFDFLPIRFVVDDSVSNITQLIARLLTANDGLAPWLPLRIKQLVGKLGLDASFGLADLAKVSLKSGGEATLEPLPVATDIFSVFRNACDELVSSQVAENGLLFVIDEFDRIADKNGFASLLKSFEGTKVRFAVVGVASDIEDIIQDHASIERQISSGSIYVDPMTDAELGLIFEQVHEDLDREYIFSEPAIDYIVRCASGHPYIVHLVGRQALISNVRARKNVITEDDARSAVRELASPGSSIPLELAYRKAVGSSKPRELILRRFAKEVDEPIRTTEIYDDLARTNGMEKETISVYVGHLCSPAYGSVMRNSGSRYYRFSNSVFKAYVNARDPML